MRSRTVPRTWIRMPAWVAGRADAASTDDSRAPTVGGGGGLTLAESGRAAGRRASPPSPARRVIFGRGSMRFSLWAIRSGDSRQHLDLRPAQDAGEDANFVEHALVEQGSP